MNVTVGLAFLAGVASFFSPCVFSLVPAYISYLSGRSLATPGGGVMTNRFGAVSHGVAFVLGFSIIFIALGVAVSAIGGLLYDLRDVLAKVGGVIVILFGLHMTGLLRIPFLEYDLRPQTGMEQSRSYFSSMLMGIFFSAGWSPCVGPTLGAIYTLVLNGGSISEGVKMLSAYSAGLAIPFIAAAFGIGWVTGLLRRYGKVMHYVEVGMGVILIAVGIMLFLGTFELIARYGFFIDFGL